MTSLLFYVFVHPITLKNACFTVKHYSNLQDFTSPKVLRDTKTVDFKLWEMLKAP